MAIQTVTDAIRYVGVDDNTLALFENQYSVQPMGVSYNSYVILDEKIAVMDSVDARAAEEWLSNVARVLEGRRPDYLVVTHMEPDHSGSLMRLAQKYPEMKIVGNAKTFTLIKQFFGTGALSEGRMLEVGERDTLSLGLHRLRFLLAPMVHWPEVMTAYEETEKILFSADAFGRFGSLERTAPVSYTHLNHLEPDHAACIEEILLRHPKVKLISNEKAFMLMRQFGFHVDGHECIEVKEGDTFSFGKHTVTFVGAPMVHWPEAMVTLDVTDGVLFSADAFGTFGALDGKLFADEVDFERDWLDDARRYLTNIVGKYGPHIQLLLKKAGGVLDQIKYICPLHGPVWRKDLGWFIEKYDTWSRYAPETQGVLIVYASMYGNTENAAQALATSLCDKGMSKVAMYDVSSTHVSQLISEAFKYSHIVLASVTYNLGIYPAMHDFLMDMKALNLQNRTFAIIENGSWAVKSGDLMQKFVNNELKNMTVLNERLSLASSMGTDKRTELEALADAILESMK